MQNPSAAAAGAHPGKVSFAAAGGGCTAGALAGMLPGPDALVCVTRP